MGFYPVIFVWPFEAVTPDNQSSAFLKLRLSASLVEFLAEQDPGAGANGAHLWIKALPLFPTFFDGRESPTHYDSTRTERSSANSGARALYFPFPIPYLAIPIPYPSRVSRFSLLSKFPTRRVSVSSCRAFPPPLASSAQLSRIVFI